MSKKPRVLFLCTGNSARSQIAEGLLRTMAGERFEALSAGNDPASSIHSMAVKVMLEKGIDISTQHPKDLSLFLGKEFINYLVVLCNKTHETCPRIWPGLLVEENRLYWPFEDPAAAEGNEEERVEVFRAIRDEIEQNLAEWIAHIDAG